jgi:rod shape-determining protein MreD
MVAAVLLQTSIGRMVEGPLPIDIVLVVTVCAGIKGGPVIGMLAGTFGGLVQDAMTAGVIGIGAWAKTTVGFLAGIVGTQFIVAKPIPRFVVLAAASALHGLVFVGLYKLLGLRDVDLSMAALGAQAFGHAVLGVIGLQALELVPGVVDRRRAARPKLRR